MSGEWVVNPGYQPVDGDREVEVMFRGGSGPIKDSAKYFFWDIDDDSYDITSYRVYNPYLHTTRVLDGWVDNPGYQPVNDDNFRVEVLCIDGEKTTGRVVDFDWRVTASENDIAMYRALEAGERPDDGTLIEFHATEKDLCPVLPNTLVVAHLRGGYITRAQRAGTLRWNLADESEFETPDDDIVAYRVVHSSMPDAEGWIKFDATEENLCPIDYFAAVEVQLRNGADSVTGTAGSLRWNLAKNGEDKGQDIVAYRVVPDGPTINYYASSDEPTPTLPYVGTNPKAAYGAAKLPLHLWPGIATAYGAVALSNGAFKYGIANYKGTEVEMSTYLSALKRHFEAFVEGEEYDPKDGQPHLGGILANVAIILEARAVGTLIDDRPIAGGYLKELDKLTEIFNDIKKLHEDKKPFHYTRNNVGEATYVLDKEQAAINFTRVTEGGERMKERDR